MKDVIISACILTALCALFAFNFYASQTCTDIAIAEMHTVSVRLESGQTGGAAAAFEAAEKTWEAQKKKIRYICHHDHIEQIDRAISAAASYIGQKDYAKAFIKTEETCFLMKDLSGHEKITLDNIF